jgi:hypothetical protein
LDMKRQTFWAWVVRRESRRKLLPILLEPIIATVRASGLFLWSARYCSKV